MVARGGVGVVILGEDDGALAEDDGALAEDDGTGAGVAPGAAHEATAASRITAATTITSTAPMEISLWVMHT